MKKSVKIAVSILAVVSVVAAIALWRMMFAGYSGGEPVRIYMAAVYGSEQVDSCLRASLGDSFGGKVARLWRISGGSPEAAHGSYVVSPGDKAVRVAKRLRNGRQTPLTFTFNNVRTLHQLAERAAERMEFSASDFLAACDRILPQRGYAREEEYAAAFLPDSYEFYWTSSPERVVRTLADTRDRFWNDERRSAARKLGLRPIDVATIASIAEEETAVAEERAVVARLYINRLHKGMKLQADPTVKFAVGDFSLRRITGKHLQIDSPYNTYRHDGLPPGPIRIADAATLSAVLAAPQHGYLYMCAKEDFSGRHNFASDAATHMANARRYRAALDRRGIR